AGYRKQLPTAREQESMPQWGSGWRCCNRCTRLASLARPAQCQVLSKTPSWTLLHPKTSVLRQLPPRGQGEKACGAYDWVEMQIQPPALTRPWNPVGRGAGTQIYPFLLLLTPAPGESPSIPRQGRPTKRRQRSMRQGLHLRVALRIRHVRGCGRRAISLLRQRLSAQLRV